MLKVPRYLLLCDGKKWRVPICSPAEVFYNTALPKDFVLGSSGKVQVGNGPLWEWFKLAEETNEGQ